MKTSTYFVAAVATSLAVPVVLGGLVFIEVYQRESKNTYVENTNENVEIVLLGDTEITNFNPTNLSESDYKNGSFIEFEVKYVDGAFGYTNFSLSMEEIDFSPNVIPEDVEWKLEKYDETIDDFRSINSGVFGNENKVRIVSKEILNLKNSVKYRLYYYVSSDENKYNRGTIHAKVVLE